MRLCRGIVITAALPLLAAIAFLAWPRVDDPLYQGRTLSQWLDTCQAARYQAALRHRASSGQLQVAENAVRRIGTNALPWLLACVDQRTPRFMEGMLVWYYRHIGKSPVTPQYQYTGAVGPADVRAAQALAGFAILGSEARDAIPELTRRLKTDTTSRVGLALVYIGPEGIPPLLAALSDPRPVKQCEAAMALLHVTDFGPYTNAAAAALIKTLKDPNADVARCAATTLGERELAPEQAVPALIESLSRPHDMYRLGAIRALGDYKGAARAAIPALVAVANEPFPMIRFEVTNALKSIASDTNQPGQVK